MESIGQTLREARHKKVASLEDASRATKIKTEILEKLESDEFDQLAAPMYTKGFLKMYAEYLGLDSQTIGDTYLRSQGGLRRQGLHVETEAAIHAHKPPELKLPIRRVIGAVAVVSVALVLGLGIRSVWSRRSAAHAPASSTAAQQKATPTATPPSAVLPKADIDAYYQPKNKPAPELLNPLEK
jgi:cytoskeletal protein RodZ